MKTRAQLLDYYADQVLEEVLASGEDKQQLHRNVRLVLSDLERTVRDAAANRMYNLFQEIHNLDDYL